ncbi:curved DNA-binding protein [Serratia symbiotica]|uniref:Curved DNA-binding protein n=1 Tax=Serratia symbiotica TaxID=138074 RepID=A0A068YWZ6_9GAMM|nr:curved DNA-binding protein [Serratia symbiotica]MBF1994902.1 curved DNA-binding protein [Serratia symbiotica]MBQ0954987.1 curved DNA-binding protein [Serratia symbiotica]QLH63990.1 curved DNA-binding protein [Serratia symbiotica]QTP14394.1 curved DNA-binding protein [Serratia symbiotica]CDS56157.1 curved DNA-binding protein, DnaJ homologue that functions as a co-chaperone of DnaK [Serratia symbiotica]
MEFKDYYATMGVDPAADLKTIKTAYRRLARQYHPDVSTEKDAESKFKELAEAYEVLKDEERRAEYDQFRLHRNDPRFFEQTHGYGGQRETGYGAGAHDFSDFFESMFGGHTARGRRSAAHGFRGQDLEMEVPLFLEETLNGQTRAISYQLPIVDELGRQVSETSKTLNVKIPAGVADGERIRLKGQGVAGVDGGQNGDLYLIIRFAPHPLFEVEGHNLHIVVPLAPWEAALGTSIEVPTLTGKIALTIPSGSQSGKRLRVKGKGVAGKKETGDLYAVLKVVMPPKPDEKISALWRELSEQVAFDPRTEWEPK